MSAWMDSRKELQQAVVVLGVGITNGKPTVMLAASSEATRGKSVHAGNLLKELPEFRAGRFTGERVGPGCDRQT
jgi:hypothetical protein